MNLSKVAIGCFSLVLVSASVVDVNPLAAQAGVVDVSKRLGWRAQQEQEAVADNGTNPAALGVKYMPYSRYTELDNGIIDQDALTLFAMAGIPISPFTALVIEWPLMKYRDFSSLYTVGGLDPGAGGGAPGFSSGLPEISDNVSVPRLLRQNITGFGDVKFRLVQGLGKIRKTVVIGGGDLILPWASDAMLSSNKYQLGPMLATVTNFSPSSFLAILHFYFFDIADGVHAADEGGAQGDIGLYLARIFFQYAWTSGWYVLPEAQVIHDFKNDDNGFSLWIGPELGTVLGANPAITAYLKPGFGINPDPGERKWSTEFGIRIIP